MSFFNVFLVTCCLNRLVHLKFLKVQIYLKFCSLKNATFELKRKTSNMMHAVGPLNATYYISN